MFWWWFMPTVHFPLSGAVTQDIETSLLRQSSSADVERDVLAGVASYGKQIGKLNEAVLALARSSGNDTLAEVDEIRRIQQGVDAAKRRHSRAPTAAQLRRDLDELRRTATPEWEALVADQASRLPRRPALPAA